MTADMILPVAGELCPSLVEAIEGGQPLALTDAGGRLVAVVVDVGSYQEMEDAISNATVPANE